MNDLIEQADEAANGLFAVTDSIVEYYERQAIKLFPQLVAEIKRLQAPVENCEDDFVCQMKSMESELARWQKIAIVERARAYWLYEQIDSNIFWDMWDRQDKSSYENEAAKELGLQVSQEAGYLERLETDYLSWVREYYRDLGEERAIAEARAALEKIRKG